MNLHPRIVLCLFGIAAMAATGAEAGTYISPPIVKNSQGIALSSINNNNNVVVGYYADASNNLHGFYGSLAGKYKTFDYTGTNVVSTIARNINDNNEIVGYAGLSTFNCDGGVEFYRTSAGKFTAIAKNGNAVMGLTQGLDNADTSVGDYWNSKCTTRTSFKAKNGVYSGNLSNVPSSKVVSARGINKSGTVVGYFTGSDGSTHGFVLENGNVTQIDNPSSSAVGTFLEDINDNGIAVGQWVDANNNQFGFTFNVKTKTFNSVLPQGSSISQVIGLNNAGFLAVNTDVGNYIYCPLSKSNCDKIAKGKVASLGPDVRPALGSTLRYLPRRIPLPAVHYPASVHMMVP
jgi:probable HAF family extracellular repeat protein